MDEQQRLDAYMKQVMNIKNKRENDQVKLDYADIVKDMGFSQEDLAAIDTEFRKAKELGRGYVAHQQADDAIEALSRAYALRPDDEITLQLLSEAYGIKYIKTNDETYKKSSEEYARACLAINPKNQASFQIIQSLRETPQTQAQWGKIAIIGAIVGGIGFGGYSVMKSPNKDRRNNNTEIVAPVTPVTPNTPDNENNMNTFGIFVSSKGDATKIQIIDSEVITQKSNLKSKAKNNEKRKYSDASGKVVYDIKYKDDGFKIRTEGDKLLWKVKISEDKIRISDNEDGKNAYEIKKKDNKFKISQNGKDLQEVKKDGSFGNAIIELNKIPLAEREVLIGEMLLKGI